MEINQTWDVLAVLVGQPSELTDGKGHSVQSAINKNVVDHTIYLSEMNFEGDRQADTKNHGGKDKAVLAYSFDHYPFWEKRLGKPFEFGAFGENLTLSGLSESDLHIGDQFQLDDAIIQVSQPRQPCFKLAFKHGFKAMPLWVEETGKSGIYFRVLKEGKVSPKPKLRLLEQGTGTLNLKEINEILFSRTPSIEKWQEVAYQEGLATSLKAHLLKKVAEKRRVD
jgi:MOSC domain-containing protein YiiM